MNEYEKDLDRQLELILQCSEKEQLEINLKNLIKTTRSFSFILWRQYELKNQLWQAIEWEVLDEFCNSIPN